MYHCNYKQSGRQRGPNNNTQTASIGPVPGRLGGWHSRRMCEGACRYITKGKKVCEMNPIPQKILEDRVIDAILDFYRPYLGTYTFPLLSMATLFGNLNCPLVEH